MNKYNFILLFSIVLLSVQSSCFNISEQKNVNKKTNVKLHTNTTYKGLSFVGNPNPITDSCLNAVKNTGANSITLMPFAFLKNLNDPIVHYNLDNQWWGETPEGIDSCVRVAHRFGIKVCMKPQLWVGNGEFTGYIKFNNNEDWISFEKSYCSFLLPFLKIAEKEKIELFCIGTELGETVKNKAEMWLNIIAFCKKHYSGKLTYAENWDCFDKFPYWNQLDFIGVDAYFPLIEKKNPSERELRKAWNKPIVQLKNCSDKFNKPILFTEFGYRSSNWACSKLWEHKNELTFNEELQAKAYNALFKKVWNQPWFAGGFAWKWFPFHKESLGEDQTEFSPQGKKAELVLKNHYSH